MAEDAMNAAFRSIQDKLGVESGDFAAAWVEPKKWDKAKKWLADYAKAEIEEQKLEIDAPVTYALMNGDEVMEHIQITPGSNAESVFIGYAESNEYHLVKVEHIPKEILAGDLGDIFWDLKQIYEFYWENERELYEVEKHGGPQHIFLTLQRVKSWLEGLK